MNENKLNMYITMIGFIILSTIGLAMGHFSQSDSIYIYYGNLMLGSVLVTSSAGILVIHFIY